MEMPAEPPLIEHSFVQSVPVCVGESIHIFISGRKTVKCN